MWLLSWNTYLNLTISFKVFSILLLGKLKTEYEDKPTIDSNLTHNFNSNHL